MITLSHSLQKWGHPEFRSVLKGELALLQPDQLLLQQGLSSSSYVSESDFSMMIINEVEQAASIVVKAGVFYTGIISGCSCADDPTPIDEVNEYCEIQLVINKATAETEISLVKNSQGMNE